MSSSFVLPVFERCGKKKGSADDVWISQNGVSYIAQVLKRNRTLKVLNLSENKLDVQGLVQIADALVGCFMGECDEVRLIGGTEI
jgi:hypothetical protein